MSLSAVDAPIATTAGARSTTDDRPPSRVVRSLPLGGDCSPSPPIEPLGAYRVLKAADPDGPDTDRRTVRDARRRRALGRRARTSARTCHVPSPTRASRTARPISCWRTSAPARVRLCELREGDGLWLLGPLGQGFTAPDARAPRAAGRWRRRHRPACHLAGRARQGNPTDDRSQAGAGLHPIARATVLLGFRDRAHAEGAALLEDAARSQVTTGPSATTASSPTFCVAELDRDAHATVYACGPPPMLEAVRALCAERDVPAQLALEAGMACGFGACYGCVVPAREGYLRVCVDGPVVGLRPSSSRCPSTRELHG